MSWGGGRNTNPPPGNPDRISTPQLAGFEEAACNAAAAATPEHLLKVDVASPNLRR